MADATHSTQPGTYTYAVKAVLINRILLVLAFIGLFVAGALSIEKYMNVMLPCGNSAGCAMVADDPSSSLFGVIPVAYIGLLGYLLMAGLAISRSVKSPYDMRLATWGFYASIAGALFSIYLQCVSLFRIHAICPYCMTSAIDMILTCGIYAWLVADIKKAGMPAREMGRADFWLTGGLGLAVIVALAIMPAQNKGGTVDIAKVELNIDSLVPPNPNSYGPPDAAVTVVEFADMCCPTCQKLSPQVKEFARKHPTTVRIVYREFPLPVHQYGRVAAAMGEYAAEKGHFWDFTLSVMGLNDQPSSVDQLLGLAKNVGLDPVDMKKRLLNPNDAVFDRVTRDLNLGHAIGVNSTPTFIILGKGLRPISVGPADILSTLSGSTYKKLLDGSA